LTCTEASEAQGVNGRRSSGHGVALVVFAAAGRGRELRRALDSLNQANTSFGQKVFSLDGHDPECWELAERHNFDHILVSHRRAGYFASVQRAFALVSEPYFFWLEDDCVIHRWPHADDIVAALEANPAMAQVRLQRETQPALRDMNRGMAQDDIALSDFLYHLHPHFGRTAVIREFCNDLAFQREAKGHNIEDALTEWTRRRGLLYGVIADGQPQCEHIGMHSTIPPGERQYHDIWSGEEVQLCNTEDAEAKLRKMKGYSQFRYANDRHDLRRGRRLWYLAHDWFVCALAFPVILLAMPFSAKVRTFIREMSRYWLR